MRVSALQRGILLRCLDVRSNRVPRRSFSDFYERSAKPPKPKDQESDLTRSMERLIDRGLLSGYGKRTPRKWFIEAVALTPEGRKVAKRLRGEQQRLPLPPTPQNNSHGKTHVS